MTEIIILITLLVILFVDDHKECMVAQTQNLLIMKTFILYWLGNLEPEKVKGYDIADAFRRAGYNGGAIAALDYYEEVK